MTKDDEEPKLYRVETVPPPAGESDAYNAPTKVGPLATAAVAEMMKAAEVAAVEHNASAMARTSAAPASQRKPPASRPVPPPPPAKEVESDGKIPRLYDKEATEGEEDAVTLVGALAKAPEMPAPSLSTPPPSAVPVVDVESRSLAPPAVPVGGREEDDGAKRGWIDILLIAIIVVAAGGAIYLLRR